MCNHGKSNLKILDVKRQVHKELLSFFKVNYIVKDYEYVLVIFQCKYSVINIIVKEFNLYKPF